MVHRECLQSGRRQPASRSAARTTSWNCGDSGASGSRSALLDHAHLGQRPFDGIGLASTNSLVCSGIRRSLMRARRRDVAGERGRAHLGHRARRDVRRDRDHAVAAEQHVRRAPCRRCPSTARSRAAAGSRLTRSTWRTRSDGRVLEPDDVRHFGEAQHRVVAEIGDGAARHVVEDQRQVDVLGDRR